MWNSAFLHFSLYIYLYFLKVVVVVVVEKYNRYLAGGSRVVVGGSKWYLGHGGSYAGGSRFFEKLAKRGSLFVSALCHVSK